MSRDLQKIVSRLYDEVHAGLWALLCAGVLYGIIFVVPRIPDIQAQAESSRLHELAAEDRLYCGKWGMPEGTPGFTRCTLDLQEIRAAAERRLAVPLDEF